MRNYRRIAAFAIIGLGLLVSAINSIDFGNYARNAIYFLLILVLAVCAYGFIALTVYILRVRLFLRDPQVQFEDISDQNLPLTQASAQKFAAQLQGWGFSRVGELKVTMAHFPSSMTFQFCDEDALISAAIGMASNVAYVRFHSRFADSATIETYYPLGFDVEAPDLRSRIIKAGLEEALMFHQHQLEPFKQLHGAIVPLADMQSLLSSSHKRMMENATSRLNHAVKRYSRFVLVLGMVLIILLPSWLHLQTQIYLDLFSLLGMIAATLVALGMVAWLRRMESDVYADKRKTDG